MVDVSAKPIQLREAVAGGEVRVQSATLDLIEKNEISKGNVLATARLAGIMGCVIRVKGGRKDYFRESRHSFTTVRICSAALSFGFTKRGVNQGKRPRRSWVTRI